MFNKAFLSFMCITLMIPMCYGDDNNHLQQIYDKSQKVASSASDSLNKLQSNSHDLSKIHVALQNKEGNANHKSVELGTLPKVGETAKEDTESTQSYNQTTTDQSGACTKDICNISKVMSSKAIKEREQKLEELGFRKNKEQFTEDNKGYLDKAHYNAKEYKNKFNAITGSYKDCKETNHESSYKENTSCDEYYDVQYKNCPISQVVEIDSKYTYQCSKKREEAIKTCHDAVVSITCKESAECDNNGILLSSVKTNLQSQSYTYPSLYVGTPYWEPYYCTIDSSKYTTFEVNNLEQVMKGSFVLERVLFDDYVMIKLNDHIVYHGPDSEVGEDRIELVKYGRYGTITTNGSNVKDCERSTHWDRRPNKDLKEYLKEGDNTLSVTIATAGHGRAEIWMKTTQHCCKEWDIKRDTKCTYEGVQ